MSNWVCPIHGVVKFVPPGVSKKTGKPYTGFFACAEPGCEQRPPKGAAPQTAPAPQQRVAAPPPRAAAPNWDKIAEGKCRSLALCAWISSGRELTDFWVHERDLIVYMMQGKPPGFDALDEQWDAMDPGPGDNDNIFGT
jgi:hypothetical protein